MKRHTLGLRLRAWRKALGLTQEKAAEAAGISQSSWSEVEIGAIAHIGLDTARRIVEVTSGTFTLDDFERPRGRRVRPVPGATESGTDVAEVARAS